MYDKDGVMILETGHDDGTLKVVETTLTENERIVGFRARRDPNVCTVLTYF